MSNKIPPVEFGAMLCKLPDGRLTRGALGVGNATSVQFPETCPPGSKVIGSFHSHPKSGGGSPLPSAQDMREAARVGMPNLCIITSEKSSCYGVRGVNAAQSPPAQRGPRPPRVRLSPSARAVQNVRLLQGLYR